METIRDGDDIMKSLRKFLVTEHDAKPKKSPRKPKRESQYNVSSSI